MFSKNGKYVIDQFQQDTFNKQLPSTSIKVSFKRQRQKILNINQKKYQIDLLKEQIYRKCKVEELYYLDLLQRQKIKYFKLKQQEQIKKQEYMLNFAKQKYAIQNKNSATTNNKNSNGIDRNSKNKTQFRDSLDEIDRNLIQNPKKIKKQQFSLQANQQKQRQKIKEQNWIRKVQLARKQMQKKLGKYYQAQQMSNDSDESSRSSRISKR